VIRLADDFQAEFPGVSGFSARNIWHMRELYAHYRERTKLQPLVAETPWSHNIAILSRCRDDLEREFYLRMNQRMRWTKNAIIHEIENRTYEKTLATQTNFDTTLPEPLRQEAVLAIRDEYTFDFLELNASF
jgi:predicted nuclease of restriction endonuclease-like (RecB) superfamily